MKKQKITELIEELSEEIKKVSWMIGVNDTDLLDALMKMHVEGIGADEMAKRMMDKREWYEAGIRYARAEMEEGHPFPPYPRD